MRLLALAAAFVLLGLVPGTLDARQARPRSDSNANHTLSARLDPAARTITGTGRLLWRNRTSEPTSELRFHLYWNAWRDGSSTWMRGRALAGDTSPTGRPEGDGGAINLSAMRLAGADTDLLARATFIAPDDGNTRDRTLLSVPLDAAVLPGETITVDFAWTARVPRVFDRTGVIGDTFFIAQWWPKIGVLEDTGWSARQLHAHTEFFADFGSYDVSLTVPSGWIVGATGQESRRKDHSDGTTTHQYKADDVHDFAWTTSPDFLVHQARFEQEGLPPVDLRLLLQPGHADQAERHLTAAREALKRLGRRLGPFPWPNLTIVDPVTIVSPRSQGGSFGGMEYPSLITAGTFWSNRWSDVTLEEVIVHEVTHQYFQSAVATDETREAWIDEGLTTWLTGDILAAAFPNRFSAIDRYFGGLVTWRHTDVHWSRLHQAYALDAYRTTPGWDAPSTPTWRMSPRTWDYSIYARTPLALETLRNLIGHDAMSTVLATFAAEGRFRHPTGDDFFALAGRTAERHPGWFLDAAINRADTFDYAVEDVVHSEGGGGRVESVVMARRLAPGVFPVDVRVTFEDGHTLTERWDDRRSWRTWHYDRAARVTRVEVDPDRVLALDVHRTNNSWTAEPRASEAAGRWTLRWITWMQQLLLTHAFFV